MKDYKNITLIIPTLNEAENIEAILNFALKNFPNINILVVDDNSNDGTIEIVKYFASINKNIKLLERKNKKGLTSAVIDGIKNARTKYIIVIDGDGQHPLNKIKDIAEKLYAGNQIVVGARKNFKNEKPFYRRLISLFANKTAVFILKAKNKLYASDVLTGFFGFERGLFIKTFNTNSKRFVMRGQKVLFDFLKCLDKNSVKISEVKIVLNERKYGKSKQSLKQGILLLKSFLS